MGLEDLSRRPHSSPLRASGEAVLEVLRLRERHPTGGPSTNSWRSFMTQVSGQGLASGCYPCHGTTPLARAENIVFIGPTGVGKTGLAGAILLRALRAGRAPRAGLPLVPRALPRHQALERRVAGTQSDSERAGAGALLHSVFAGADAVDLRLQAQGDVDARRRPDNCRRNCDGYRKPFDTQRLPRNTSRVFTGNDIRDLREALGMTPAQFATLLGIHPATLYRWEAKGGEPVRLDPMQLGILTALRDEFGRRTATGSGDEWVAALLGALLVGGGLFAIFKLLEAVFEESPSRKGGSRARR